MLATISPSSEGYVETMNTLKYAERLRRASGHLYWNRDSNSMKIAKVKSCYATMSLAGNVQRLTEAIRLSENLHGIRSLFFMSAILCSRARCLYMIAHVSRISYDMVHLTHHLLPRILEVSFADLGAVDQVSDVMKQEMKGLVEKLGQDGVEAKRQVNKT